MVSDVKAAWYILFTAIYIRGLVFVPNILIRIR